MGSNGSVIPFFLKKRKNGILPITHPNMTRFNISLLDGVKMVINALNTAWGGEIFIPKIPSYKIMDLAEAICSDCKKEIVGIRPGEKIHEQMIGYEDGMYTYEYNDYYKILPLLKDWCNDSNRIKDGIKVPENFRYISNENKEWMSVENLRIWIENFLKIRNK